jgi:hypothetical protein
VFWRGFLFAIGLRPRAQPATSMTSCEGTIFVPRSRRADCVRPPGCGLASLFAGKGGSMNAQHVYPSGYPCPHPEGVGQASTVHLLSLQSQGQRRKPVLPRQSNHNLTSKNICAIIMFEISSPVFSGGWLRTMPYPPFTFSPLQSFGIPFSAEYSFRADPKLSDFNSSFAFFLRNANVSTCQRADRSTRTYSFRAQCKLSDFYSLPSWFLKNAEALSCRHSNVRTCQRYSIRFHSICKYPFTHLHTYVRTPKAFFVPQKKPQTNPSHQLSLGAGNNEHSRSRYDFRDRGELSS